MRSSFVLSVLLLSAVPGITPAQAQQQYDGRSAPHDPHQRERVLAPVRAPLRQPRGKNVIGELKTARTEISPCFFSC